MKSRLLWYSLAFALLAACSRGKPEAAFAPQPPSPEPLAAALFPAPPSEFKPTFRPAEPEPQPTSEEVAAFNAPVPK
ncbi:MAG: hypothetical protein QM767_17965 [Anaeromyxobacter sp.]